MRVVFGVEDVDLIRSGRKVLTELIHSIHPFIVFFRACSETGSPSGRGMQAPGLSLMNGRCDWW